MMISILIVFGFYYYYIVYLYDLKKINYVDYIIDFCMFEEKIRLMLQFKRVLIDEWLVQISRDVERCKKLVIF